MSENLTKRVDFNFIRYSNCWEDADLLLEGLKPEKGSRILSIGSAGDNSLSLLTCNPSEVIAVDVNQIQLYLIELKKQAFINLSYSEMLEFLGFYESNMRFEYFKKIQPFLSIDCNKYWVKNIDIIEQGVIHTGKFEHYFELFRKKILPLIHTKKRTTALLKEKTANEQLEFYHKTWNTFRWKMLFKVFFSKFVMGKFGRDPEFFNEVKVEVSKFIFSKAEAHLSRIDSTKNEYLHYIFTGSFDKKLPHYARQENFELIKRNASKLRIEKGYAENYITKENPIDYINFSNIFEYMNSTDFKNTSQKIIENIPPNCRIAYWNLMVPRKLSDYFSSQIQYLEDFSNELTEHDKGFFYKQFIIEQRL
ncbi:MAG: DUF3419 family protein [Bacteroidota bacterium]